MWCIGGGEHSRETWLDGWRRGVALSIAGNGDVTAISRIPVTVCFSSFTTASVSAFTFLLATGLAPIFAILFTLPIIILVYWRINLG